MYPFLKAFLAPLCGPMLVTSWVTYVPFEEEEEEEEEEGTSVETMLGIAVVDELWVEEELLRGT